MSSGKCHEDNWTPFKDVAEKGSTVFVLFDTHVVTSLAASFRCTAFKRFSVITLNFELYAHQQDLWYHKYLAQLEPLEVQYATCAIMMWKHTLRKNFSGNQELSCVQKLNLSY